jgi:hypothetical protein
MAVLRLKKTYQEYSMLSLVAQNLKDMIEYGLLEAGAYTNVEFDNSVTSGLSILQPPYNNSYGGQGRVYEFAGPSLVWQETVMPPSGIDSPIIPSGIFIDGDFYETASTSGEYEHVIDFRNGRVIFESPLSGGEVVSAEYSFPNVFVDLGGREEHTRMFKNFLHDFETTEEDSPGGNSNVNKESRGWFPSVFIVTSNRNHARGLQLGGGEVAEVTVRWDVFSDNAWSRNWLVDLIGDQVQRSFSLYNVNAALSFFPFLSDGSLNPNRKEYPTLLQDHYWNKAFINSSRGETNANKTSVFVGAITQSIEINRYGF